MLEYFIYTSVVYILYSLSCNITTIIYIPVETKMASEEKRSSLMTGGGQPDPMAEWLHTEEL